ncbi:S1 family peptidase [Saccharophagus degradans]|uniref:Serine protease n=1 Tax=Saccharophagus degradans TaxID=86304 RepID=A0AAW7X3V1_9GAMM|nr:serine protease [Saccharophagus degradans]MDO6421537.1 serine protease [Saccharophagus degradans]MDO6608649.1 serine protease [Saccharophagus degradans]
MNTTKYSAIGQCAHWLAAVSLSVCALISGPAYTQELAPNNKPAVDSGQQAKHTISTFKDSIFQVRIINVDSKNARSFGSGFYIGDGGLIATNYHVINSVLFEPENYRAIIEIGDEEIPLNIEAVDAISDVAILSVPVKRPALALSAVPPARGERLYSVGNPHDLGMTIVEGNYNGLIDNRFFDQIHFSGALNPGMSGGPNLNANGEVVGLNVATKGNQVGFLVPVDKLKTLLVDLEVGKYSEEELQQKVGKQIQKASHYVVTELLSPDWPIEDMGEALVVGKVHPNLHCWGDSDEDEDNHLIVIKRGCHSAASFPIYKTLTSGFVEYEFWHIQGKDWPEYSYYRMLQKQVSHARPGNQAGEDDVENYTCEIDIVTREQDGLKRKISYCTRPYKKFKGLYDVFYMGVTLDKSHVAVMEHFTLSGVTQEDSAQFLEKFIKQVAWQ